MDREFWEEETDYNQHHPLVSDLTADNHGDITYEPPPELENGDGDWKLL